jgi:LmbE family N-acetylglucosaminyl deacetylase
MESIRYIDISKKIGTDDIGCLFPGWETGKENLAVFSPHDDDAIIGAGYAIYAAQNSGANTYIFIFCRGNAGYSDLSMKHSIEHTREDETILAYEALGIKEENIIRFNYSDFSVRGNIGWQTDEGLNGSFKPVLTKLRELKITRVLVPNPYREHTDHEAVSYIGSFDSPQAGDPILVDWAEPNAVRSIAQYSVWSDLSPEDALVGKRDTTLRANRMIMAPEQVEKKVAAGISCYASQGRIIRQMIEDRAERRTKNGKYIEVYLAFDPRPKMDYSPYIQFADSI